MRGDLDAREETRLALRGDGLVRHHERRGSHRHLRLAARHRDELAQRLGAGFIPVRKSGKLPAKTEVVEYTLEYGTDRLEIHADACNWAERPRVLIVDDVLATGGTADATRRLIERLGGEVLGFSFLIALSFLPGLDRLRTSAMQSLVTY